MARRTSRAATEWRRVALVRSASGNDPHDVTTDGTVLRCDCMAWRFCPNPKTCRHVEEVAPRLAELGGISTAYRLLGSGLHLDTTGGRNQTVTPTRRRASLADRIERLIFGLASQQAMPDHSWRAEWRNLRAEVEAADARVPTAAAVAIVEHDAPDWLGGGRAILLRD